MRTQSIATPLTAPFVNASAPSSRIVGCTSPRQSGCEFVHAGKMTELSACNDGGCVHENSASRARVFSVSSAATAWMSSPKNL